MRKAIAVKDFKGKIDSIYFLEDSNDLLSRETTFTTDEWNRGVAKWQWENQIKEELKRNIGIEYMFVGNEQEDVGNGYLYRIYFVDKTKFSRRDANAVIEEFIEHWELQDDKNKES